VVVGGLQAGRLCAVRLRGTLSCGVESCFVLYVWEIDQDVMAEV
jgi:hypothetical protein